MKKLTPYIPKNLQHKGKNFSPLHTEKMDADWTKRFEVIRQKAPEQGAILDLCGPPEDFSEGHALHSAVVGTWKLLSAKTKAPAVRKILTEEEIEEEKTTAKISALRTWVNSEAPVVKSEKVRKMVFSYISKEFGEAAGGLHEFIKTEDFVDGVVSTLIHQGIKELMETLQKAGQKTSGRKKTLKDGREVSDSDFFRRKSDEMEGTATYTSRMGKTEEVEFLHGVEGGKNRFHLGDWKGSKWVSVEVLKSSKDGSGMKQVKVKDLTIEDPRPVEGKCKCACVIKKFGNLCEQSVGNDDRFIWEGAREAPEVMKACGAPSKEGGMCSRHGRMVKQGKDVVEWSEEHLCGLTLTPVE